MNHTIARITIVFIFFTLSCKEDHQIIDPPASTQFIGLPKTKEISAGRMLPTGQNPFTYCNDANAKPTGGGANYDRIVTTGSVIFNPNSVTDPVILGNMLKTTIESAAPSATVFIPGNLVITVTQSILVNKPMTIASNRGFNGSEGALIVSLLPHTDSNLEIFRVTSNAVRITGIRLAGNPSESLIHNGIEVESAAIDLFEVDNCEISQWGRGIELIKTNTTNFSNPAIYQVKIHHNDIYSNFREGYGYGVSVNLAYPEIYGNIFEANRHDVAGTGVPSSGYHAYCNTMLSNHDHGVANLDMHSENGNTSPNAGTFIKIDHNDFQGTVCQGNIFITGKPDVVCIIMNNRFATGNLFLPVDNCPTTSSIAISNRPENKDIGSPAYGNVIAVNNIYNNSYLGWYVMDSWNSALSNNFLRIPSTNDLLHSMLNPNVVPTNWVAFTDEQTLDYWFGDFNGDGNTDIFKATGQGWYYLPLNTGYTTQWTSIATSSYTLGKVGVLPGTSDFFQIKPDMELGNFDEGPVTDIAVVGSSTFDVSYNGSPWVHKASTDRAIDQYRFGRFSNTGSSQFIYDALKITGATWSTSFDLAPTWANQPKYSVQISSTKIGNFDNMPGSDVFYTTGTQWKYSSNGSSAWINLSNSSHNADQLILGDFNADGISDVICLSNMTSGFWQTSLGGVGSWKSLTISEFPTTGFVYGNLKMVP